jgi:hypothetical protein
MVMSEPTYTFTLTETERAAFAKVLGGLVTKLLNAPVEIAGEIQCKICGSFVFSEAALTEHLRKDHSAIPPARPTDPTSGPVQIKGELRKSEEPPPARPADPTSGTDHARAILSPPAAAQSKPTATPIALRDRWARDRKGNELPNPSGCESVTVHIWKTERKLPRTGENKTPFLKVTWYASEGNGYGDANCFDEKLFPWIAAQSKEPTALLYVVKSGKYLNVVGIRA